MKLRYGKHLIILFVIINLFIISGCKGPTEEGAVFHNEALLANAGFITYINKDMELEMTKVKLLKVVFDLDSMTFVYKITGDASSVLKFSCIGLLQYYLYKEDI